MKRRSPGPGRPRSWFAVLYTHTVLVQAITFVLRPTAIYKGLELDVPAAWLGALGASFALVPLALAVPCGQAADRFGERRVMLLGAALTALSCAGYVTLGGSVLGLFAATVLLGTGHLLAVVGQQALVANLAPVTRYDTAFGHYTFAASAGQAIGPGLIILFGGSAPIPETAGIFSWSLAFAALLLLVTFVLPSLPSTSKGDSDGRGSIRTLLRRPGLLPALTASSIVLAAVDVTLVFLPVLGAERGIPAGTIGILLAVRAGASMTSRLFLGRLTGWLGRGRVLTGSIAASAVTLALVAVPMPLWLLATVVVAAGLALGAGQPVTMSWLAEAAPRGMRGRAMGLRLTGNRLGQVVFPTTAGLLAAAAGAAGVFLVTAGALMVVSAVARRVEPARTPGRHGSSEVTENQAAGGRTAPS